MCGIIAAVGSRSDLGSLVWNSLCQLEYRGYDSFGISYHLRDRSWGVVKKIGAPSEWRDRDVLEQNISCALGHTRWATHGAVTLKNAHPHNWTEGPYQLSLVHNGVVENLDEWNKLLSQSMKDRLSSETDSEKILALIVQYIISGLSVEQSFQKVIHRIKGSYAIILADLNTDTLWAARKDLPLYSAQDGSLGYYFVSDLGCLPTHLEMAYALKNEEILEIRGQKRKSLTVHSLIQDNFKIENFRKKNVPPSLATGLTGSSLEREIFEQEILLPMLSRLGPLDDFSQIEEIHFVGCGSSFYAAEFAAQFFHSLNIVPAHAYVASNFRDRPPIVNRKTLLMALSQSGETADVLGAVRDRRHVYSHVAALCNRSGSMLEQLVDSFYALEAGPEYSVASTKAFTSQLIQLFRFFCHDNQKIFICSDSFQKNIAYILEQDVWTCWASSFLSAPFILLLARNYLLPIAHEGALKIRELSYKPTLAIASGELKHGSLALIDSLSASIICVPFDEGYHKHLLAVQEIHARKGRLWVLLQDGCDSSLLPEGVNYVRLPKAANALETAIYFTIAFQMIAFRLASLLGQSLDRPRNLAKSVTVE